jgi:hypothetical protein
MSLSCGGASPNSTITRCVPSRHGVLAASRSPASTASSSSPPPHAGTHARKSSRTRASCVSGEPIATNASPSSLNATIRARRSGTTRRSRSITASIFRFVDWITGDIDPVASITSTRSIPFFRRSSTW